MTNEREFIDWLRRNIPASPLVPVGIGDDAALLKVATGELLITVDMLLEGVHFDLSNCSARQVGRKSMNVNISDIAAMGGKPIAAVVAVGLPASVADLAEELSFGLREAADAFEVAIIGGDTNRSSGGLVISVTVFGLPTHSRALLRSGAKPGDAVFVTGELGFSLLGKHLDFTPRVKESLCLHEHYQLHSMIDLSDGLASDLRHLTDESSCGAIIEAEAIPIARPAGSVSDARSRLDHALNDGEDFELLFTLSPNEADRLIAERPLDRFHVRLTRIGVMTSERTVLLRERGHARPLPRGGFVHNW